jgi:hypothetical protein
VIEISIGDKSVYSSHTDNLLLPEIRVETLLLPISVSGLSEQYPHSMNVDMTGATYVASFFLHPHITAHVKADKFDIYLTNAEVLIGCLVCLKDDFFKVTQSIKERISSYTSLGHYDFVHISEGETAIIESFGLGEERATDKHASI